MEQPHTLTKLLVVLTELEKGRHQISLVEALIRDVRDHFKMTNLPLDHRTFTVNVNPLKP